MERVSEEGRGMEGWRDGGREGGSEGGRMRWRKCIIECLDN